MSDLFPDCAKDKKPTEPEKFFPLVPWGMRTAGSQLPPAQEASDGQEQLHTRL